MAGGTIIIKPPKEFKGKSHEHVIAGNTILYGATGGQVFISGIVGERFAVRNSGAVAVAEGAGDHLCEYMTAGTVLILGKTGINIGAGMTGGTLYIYDPMQEVKDKINTSYVKIAELEEEEDIKEIRDLIIKHLGYTDSDIAKEIIDNFEEEINNFVKVVPPLVEKAAQETDELEVRK